MAVKFDGDKWIIDSQAVHDDLGRLYYELKPIVFSVTLPPLFQEPKFFSSIDEAGEFIRSFDNELIKNGEAICNDMF